MGIVKGLKGLNAVMDKPQSNSEGSKARWVKLEDGESVKIRFLQELDPDSPTYNEKLGLGFIAVEHTNPKDYRRKGLWKGRSRLYINVLVDDGKEEPYVAILSQGSSGKTVTPTLIEYAGEMGSITNLMWRIKRSGTKTDTSYTIIPLAKDEAAFDASTLELYKLEETAVRDLPYTEQEAFFNGEGGNSESDSATSSNLDW
jgi:hypothetical protein